MPDTLPVVFSSKIALRKLNVVKVIFNFTATIDFFAFFHSKTLQIVGRYYSLIVKKVPYYIGRIGYYLYAFT